MAISVLWVARQEIIHLRLHLLLDSLAHYRIWKRFRACVTDKVRKLSFDETKDLPTSSGKKGLDFAVFDIGSIDLRETFSVRFFSILSTLFWKRARGDGGRYPISSKKVVSKTLEE